MGGDHGVELGHPSLDRALLLVQLARPGAQRLDAKRHLRRLRRELVGLPGESLLGVRDTLFASRDVGDLPVERLTFVALVNGERRFALVELCRPPRQLSA